MTERRFILGLDLGTMRDPTALAVLEKTRGPDPGKPTRTVNHYALVHLERWPLGTTYPAIEADLKAMLETETGKLLRRGTLVVDQTGVGLPVVQHLRAAGLRMSMKPIVITGGQTPRLSEDKLAFHVPKRDLAMTLVMLLQSKRMLFAHLELTPVLVRELQTFKVKVSAAGNESFEAWRESDHDDLVLALGLAAWLGERGGEWADALRLIDKMMNDEKLPIGEALAKNVSQTFGEAVADARLGVWERR